MTTDDQVRLTPILQRIANALVEATPEWWSEAAMRCEVQKTSNGETGISHSISSKNYPQDIVLATDDLFVCTRELQLLCESNGHPWSALAFRINQSEDGWHFTTDFEYAA